MRRGITYTRTHARTECDIKEEHARSSVRKKKERISSSLARSGCRKMRDDFQEREKIPKKRTLQHPRMTFTVFHHASIRVPGRLERPSAVGRLHRAGGGPFFLLFSSSFWWSSSSSRWESSTNRSMSCVGIEVFLSLCRKAKREKVSALFLAGCEKVRENAREASATPKRSRSNHARYFSP